jgi:scaffold protein salvador
MLSRKNKDLKTIKEGVVGKYVKKDTPPEMPSEPEYAFLTCDT